MTFPDLDEDDGCERIGASGFSLVHTGAEGMVKLFEVLLFPYAETPVGKTAETATIERMNNEKNDFM